MSESEETVRRVKAFFPIPRMESDFACLVPRSPLAKKAFSEAVDFIFSNGMKYAHAARSMRVLGKAADDEEGSDGEEIESGDGLEPSMKKPRLWDGYYALNLGIESAENVSDRAPDTASDKPPTKAPYKAPHNDKRGWRAGTEHKKLKQGVLDLLLAPPTQYWSDRGVRADHFLLTFSTNCHQMMVEAERLVTLGRDDVKRGTPYVLEDGDTVGVGDCSYLYEYAPPPETPYHDEQFVLYMWQVHRHSHRKGDITAPRAPTAVTHVVKLEKGYSFVGGSFSQGGFGKVHAGYRRRGGIMVAIKQFTDSRHVGLQAHKKLMDLIGKHDNVVQLEAIVQSSGAEFTESFCIYTPLGIGSLQRSLEYHEIDIPTIVSILIDCFCGLVWLHGKGIIHRDMKTENIGIIAFANPRAFLIDFDVAIQAAEATESVGTEAYWAPEISRGSKIQTYDNSIDVWAMGVVLLIYLRLGFTCCWAEFDHAEDVQAYEKESVAVLVDTLTPTRFHHAQTWLDGQKELAASAKKRIAKSAENKHYGRLVAIASKILSYDKAQRPSAQSVVDVLVALKRELNGRARIQVE
ncbi:MAG: hypothetical protein Q9207_003080 [Kuettlingeria erythrocarpa]